MKENKKITLRSLTKGNVWDLQENDIFALWSKPEKEDEISERGSHYMDIVRTAFDVEEIKVPKREVIEKYEERGMKVGVLYLRGEPVKKDRSADKDKPKRGRAKEARESAEIEHDIIQTQKPQKVKEPVYAIRKRPITKVTDLSYENIHHISAAKLLDIIDRNFGGGWDSLNQGVKDIILSAFDISTTTTPKERLHKPGGLYQIKVEDGYEVLEIEKGGWVEAIFAKVKPKAIKLKMSFDEENKNRNGYDGDDSDEDVEVRDDYYKQDEDDDDIDEDSLTEESYRTTVEENPDDLSLDDADEISDEEY